MLNKTSMTSLVREAAVAGLKAINRGDRHHCPICETDFARFIRRGKNPMRVGCRSLARHRLMVLYLQRETDLLRGNRRLLHIAPEPGVSTVLSAARSLDTVTVDIDDDAPVRVQPTPGIFPSPTAASKRSSARMCSSTFPRMSTWRARWRAS